MIEPASEPDDGSVRQNAAKSPEDTLGRYLAFCSGVPKSKMPLKPIDWCAPNVIPTPITQFFFVSFFTDEVFGENYKLMMKKN